MKTEREGMEDLLNYLEESGFYKAPCSGGYHLAKDGGLLEHSLNVLHIAEKLSVALYGAKNLTKEMKDSIAICALLHDVGKCGDYGKPLYVPNVLKTTGKQSEKKPYERNKQLTNIPHSFKSAIIAERWIDLTEEEEFAIMYHDGLYDRETGGMSIVPGHETPLWFIVHWADMWASHVIEIEGGQK
jgi:23S rRNA maturation-related 3'-5' exoribonuclease YhaM